MGKRKRKSKKKGSQTESEELVKAPHSFVIKRGAVSKSVNRLMMDFRKLMEPYTAMNLRVKKKNVIKDFVSIAGALNVTHIVAFTQTTKAVYFKTCRLPQGPSLTYKVVNYTLASDVLSSLKRQFVNSNLYQLSPLVIMNGFSGGESLELKLFTSMWRNMFPSIDINKINLNTVKRCILLNYDPETKLVEFRHYAIRIRPVGLSKSVKKLITSKKIPDLGNLKSVDEVMEKEAAYTESEGENDDAEETRHVTLPQPVSSRGNLVNEKSSIRLIEIGPRIRFELMKIQEGLMGGEVIYHSLITKTKAEVKELKKQRQQRIRLKLSRKRQQEENVRKKQLSAKRPRVRFRVKEEDAAQDEDE